MNVSLLSFSAGYLSRVGDASRRQTCEGDFIYLPTGPAVRDPGLLQKSFPSGLDSVYRNRSAPVSAYQMVGAPQCVPAVLKKSSAYEWSARFSGQSTRCSTQLTRASGEGSEDCGGARVAAQASILMLPLNPEQFVSKGWTTRTYCVAS